MNINERELTHARADADRQRAHALGGVNELSDRVRVMLAQGRDATDIWAILGVQACRALDCDNKYSKFAVEMLIAAVIELTTTQSTEDTGGRSV